MPKITGIMLLILLTGCFLLAACSPPAPSLPITRSSFLLNTVCQVTVYDEADQDAAAAALALCRDYDALLSRTAEGSDIWRINHSGGEARQVDAATKELISLALEYGELSGGQFDITIGRLAALWDFGNREAPPTPEEVEAARQTVDYRQVSVEDNLVKLADSRAWLDLGGIAKGYIADKMAAFLRDEGVERAIIDLGGNIVTLGLKEDGSLWSVGVRKPFAGPYDLVGVLNVEEAAVVTSGVYERYFIEGDTLYHHILDPKDGFPVKSDIASVTLVTASSAQGDALATIMLFEGSHKVPELLKQYPDLLGAVLVLHTGEILTYGDISFTPSV